MKWWLLIGAIGAEVFATSSLRAATAAEPAWPWWLSATGGYVVAFALFYAALTQGAPLAAAYAIWAGIGVALTAIVALAVFAEPLTLGSSIGIGLVVAGVVLIELFAARPGETS